MSDDDRRPERDALADFQQKVVELAGRMAEEADDPAGLPRACDVVRRLFPTAGPLGSVSRAEVLAEAHDWSEALLIAWDRRAQAGELTQHLALARGRLLVYHDWLERESLAAYAALAADVAERLRSGEAV